MTVITLMLLPAAAIAAKAPDFTVSAETKNGQLVVSALPPAGHHFNTKAPMSLQCKEPASKFKPVEAGEQLVVFKLPCPKERNFDVTLYLCDDKKSFCEDHKVSVTWNIDSTTAGISEPMQKPQKQAPEKSKKPGEKKQLSRRFYRQ
jgi:hypothetical protein